MNFTTPDIFQYTPIVKNIEIGAYEYLWSQSKVTFKRISEMFKKSPGLLPSELLNNNELAYQTYQNLIDQINKSNLSNIDINAKIYGDIQYPEKLRDAKYPIELLYYRGDWSLAEYSKSIAIVGSRKPSDDGLKRTIKLAKLLVKNDYIVVSGLAEGIDTAAHSTAIKSGGKTIAVIGTPINQHYPKSNQKRQDYIAKEHLLISQVPILKHSQENWHTTRAYFPERNKTMSALTQATIIVEASETSGTLIQAKAALEQGRKLFILNSCFENPNISWPQKFLDKGAVRIRNFDDILATLE